MQKYLDVMVANNQSTYLWYSIKASILQTNISTHHWFNNRFINVVSYNAYSAPWPTLHQWLKLDYIEHNEPERTYNDLLEFYSYNNNSIRSFDVAQFVKECILEYKYVQLEVDEYYVYAKDNYYKEHFSHPVLIYGFNEELSVYHCIGFGKHNVFMKFTMTQLELYESAYSAAEMIRETARMNPDHDVAAVTIVRKDSTVPPFDCNKFYNSLNQFIYSTPDPDYIWVMSQVGGLQLCGYGVEALKNVPQCIRQEKYENLNIAYLDFVFLQERNLGLFNRMKWYLKAFGISNAETDEMMNRYEKLTKEYRKFHFLILREYSAARDFFVTNSPKRFEIADMLDGLILEEQLILDGLQHNILT